MGDRIAISKIRRDGGTQTRERIDADTVESYADAMRGGAEFPKPVVFYDGKDYWLADGFHRTAASIAIGVDAIECEVRQGDRRAAILFSVGANATNSLRRTNADKRRAVSTLLDDEEWAKWADQHVAERCAVGREFVRRIRVELAPSTCTPDAGSDEPKRLGMDGKWRRMPRGGKGKARPLTEQESQLLDRVPRGDGIYVLMAGGLFKIGWSRTPRQRVEGLLGQYLGSELVAIAGGDQRCERAVHDAIAGEREFGEWFRCGALSDVVDAMMGCGLRVFLRATEDGKTRKPRESASSAIPANDEDEEPDESRLEVFVGEDEPAPAREPDRAPVAIDVSLQAFQISSACRRQRERKFSAYGIAMYLGMNQPSYRAVIEITESTAAATVSYADNLQGAIESAEADDSLSESDRAAPRERVAQARTNERVVSEATQLNLVSRAAG